MTKHQRARGTIQEAAGMTRTTVNEMMTLWDTVLLAKHQPGVHNVPFITDMNVSSASTGIIHSLFSMNSTYKNTGFQGYLGDDDYTLIGFCPSLTACYGPGGLGNIPMTSKCGGIFIKTIADPAYDCMSFANFYGIPKGCMSMAQVLGS